MTFPNILTKEIADQMIGRIDNLTPDTQPLWGKMNVGQMLAHCCVAYETVFTDKHPRPNFLTRFIVKLLAKQAVVGPKPYPRNGRTAPHFIIADERDFNKEKDILIGYLNKCVELGPDYFDGKDSHSLGVLTLDEWNSLFYKHLDHHLGQFGV